MANRKKPTDKKKSKISLTIDEKIVSKLDEYLKDEEIQNRSKYIEKLVREDMEKRGKDVSKEF
jgi:metal-responsive CopG/Arc/MetJ family transcriptional regulator